MSNLSNTKRWSVIGAAIAAGFIAITAMKATAERERSDRGNESAAGTVVTSQRHIGHKEYVAMTRLMERAGDALGAHDLVKAESLLRDCERLYGDQWDLLQSDMAQVLDEEGRSKDAYVYYGKLAHNPLAGGERSAQHLMRYGELAEKYGDPGEAEYAYRSIIVAQNRRQFTNYPPIPLNGDESPSRLKTLAQLVTGASTNNLSMVRAAAQKEPWLAISHLYLGLVARGLNRASFPNAPHVDWKAEVTKAAELGSGDVRIQARQALQGG